MPLSVPKWPIAFILMGCGFTKLPLLLFQSRNTTVVRISMALTVAIYSFWAAALTFDFFRLHQTSMQLPLTYMGLASLGFILLLEPFTNPATAKSEE